MQVSTITAPAKNLNEKSRRCYVPKRFIFTFLGFFGMINVHALRSNLGVAMVAMVNSTKSEFKNSSFYEEECHELLDYNEEMTVSRNIQVEQYDWDAKTQGVLMSAFFYAYFVTTLCGGYFAEKFGANKFLGGGVFVTAVLTLLTPAAVRWGVTPFIIVRVLEGLGEGFSFPSMNAMISRWAPKLERSRISSIVHSGTSVGTVLGLSVSGWLCKSDIFGGWPSVFYVFGAVGCVWFVFWCIFIYETPDAHSAISEEELSLFYQFEEDKISRTKVDVHWKKIITSKPMLGVLAANIGCYFGTTVLMTEFPNYLNSVLHFSVETSGLVTGLPHLLETFGAITSSIVADKLIKSRRLSVTAVRKIFNSISMYGSGIFLMSITVSGCRPTLIITLYSIVLYVNGFRFSGYQVTHVDMFPPLAGTLFGMTNSIASLGGIVAPNMVGAFIATGATAANWNKVFYATSGVYFTMATLYNIFASAELQQWNIETLEGKKSIPAETKT